MPPASADLATTWAFLEEGVDHIMTKLQTGVSYFKYISIVYVSQLTLGKTRTGTSRCLVDLTLKVLMPTEQVVLESLSKVFHPPMADGEMRDPSPKRDGSSAQEGNVLCSLGEEKFVGFAGVAVPRVEDRALDSRPPALDIRRSSCVGQPSSHEGQKPDSNTDTLFDPHTAGRKVVDGVTQTAYEPSHFTSDHSDLTEDKSTTYKRSNRRKQRQVYEVKGKQSIPILAPHVHPDDFEDPVSDEFWDRVWVACAKHNVSTYFFDFHTCLASLALVDGDISQGVPCDSG